MIRKNRVPAALAAAAIAVCGVSVPAMASASSTKWTKAQCESYVKSFEKKHPHATKSQVSSANKTLKSWSCKQQVK